MSTPRSKNKYVPVIVAGRRGLALLLDGEAAVIDPTDLGASVADLRAGGLRLVRYIDGTTMRDGVAVDSLATFAGRSVDKVPVALRALHAGLPRTGPAGPKAAA